MNESAIDISVITPAFKILWSQHDDALCHLRRYERRTLLSEIKETGLKIEKSGYFFFASFFAVAPIRIARRIFNFKQKEAHSDTTTLPPKILNEFLKKLFEFEIKLSQRPGLPFGTTIYAVVSKCRT